MKNARLESFKNIFVLLLVLAIILGLFYYLITNHLKFYEVNKQEEDVEVPLTLDKAVEKQYKNDTKMQIATESGNWKDATRNEIRDVMDVEKILTNKKQVYQFLNLSEYQGIDEKRIHHMLRKKEILEKYTSQFINAAKKEHVNEVYLISHAILETGNNKSKLANGVMLTDKGKVAHSKSESDGKKYYNFYGVGALDEDPIGTGARYAKKQGWDSPKKAITGGAKFIHDHYLSNPEQNTLYSMRWNPEKPGVHQYATDIKWAQSNARIIADFYEELKTEGKYYTVYKYEDTDNTLSVEALDKKHDKQNNK
ncbi:N-acetylglucosaminidase [Mammaliicoccus stepanovicii]|uniref:Glucosaminidase n=1 Tax=Mammaliicoccus stepanovicii TaxID=643214 RepID=A0A239YZD1_9STAP|nr:N-acetylglucosaminidase [Mammaliicoccus stepanovicii]PNZ75604.1 autolysin [Mammaliicoccus stepanovicii]GGI40519.1 autolysin [Mammaliicoccus stepanovicii]SNV63604.1 glucosaminidase [Mammaliicoccus stepanovicii]